MGYFAYITLAFSLASLISEFIQALNAKSVNVDYFVGRFLDLLESVGQTAKAKELRDLQTFRPEVVGFIEKIRERID